MPQPILIIPARMGSTRLPGKPLADIHGEPMIVHVWRRACEADIGPVVVAVDSPELARAIENAGGRAALTDPDHPSGSDRIFEALQRIDPGGAYELVVNLQGDLPTIEPASLRAVLEPLKDEEVAVSTLAAEIARPEERDDPNVVKLVGSALSPRRLRALYFTRARAPWGEGPLFCHIGVYAWRRTSLARFVALPASALERREKLEQLRALEAGMRIDAAIVDTAPIGVDAPQDLVRARAALAPASSRSTET